MISWLSEPTLKAPEMKQASLTRYFSKFADTVHSSQLFSEEFQYASDQPQADRHWVGVLHLVLFRSEYVELAFLHGLV